MVRQRAAWQLLALAAGAWLAGCGVNPAQPGQSQFDWVINPAVLIVTQGGTGSVAIRLNSKVNINSDVDFSVSGSVPNGTVTLAPQRLGSTGRDAGIAVQTSSQTPVGSYTLHVTANEVGYGTHTLDVRVDVVAASPDAPDFLLEVTPTEFTFTDRRQSGPTITYFVRPRNNFAGTVTITIDGIEIPPAPLVLGILPTPSQITFAAGDGGRGGSFVPVVAERPSYPATWILTVRATSGAITHSLPVNFALRFGAF
jgi:hypothetical protein